MSSNSVVKDSTYIDRKPQHKQVTDLSSADVEPDYQRYEFLESELSDDLNLHEYSNAARDIAREQV